MMYDDDHDELVFTSGLRVYSHDGTVGVGPDGKVGYGKDGAFHDHNMTDADWRELAAHMIERWQAVARRHAEPTEPMTSMDPAQDKVDFREHVTTVIGRIKWVEDVLRYGDAPLSNAERLELSGVVEQAYVAIRLLIKCGLVPADLWGGARGDDIWVRPAGEWPQQEGKP